VEGVGGADLVGVIAILILQSQKGKCVLVVVNISGDSTVVEFC
jgi:hypothetical protein